MSKETTKGIAFGRRTWDEDEYAQRARERYNAKRSKNHHDGDNSDNKMKASKFFDERRKYIDQIDGMSKISFVSSIGAKDSGFYCDVCNRKFKDNLKYIDHLNSTEHLTKSGFDMNEFMHKDVSLDQVKERLENLKRVIEEKDHSLGSGSGRPINLQERIEERKRYQEKEREKRRIKRSNKRQKKQNSVIEGEMVMNNENKEQDDLSKIMGFNSFGV